MARQHAGKERQLSTRQRRKLSEEGKRLLWQALTHEDGEFPPMQNTSAISTTAQDDSSLDSDLESGARVGIVGAPSAQPGNRRTTKKKQHQHQPASNSKNNGSVDPQDMLLHALEELSSSHEADRVQALGSILTQLTSAVLTKSLAASTRMALTSRVLASLKRKTSHGGSESLALRVVSVMAITMGPSEQVFYDAIRRPLQRILMDSVSDLGDPPSRRIEAAYALSIACFVCCREDQQRWELIELLGTLLLAGGNSGSSRGEFYGNNEHGYQRFPDEDEDEDEESDPDSDAGLVDVPDELLAVVIECWAFLVSACHPASVVPKLEDRRAVIFDHIRVLTELVRKGVDPDVRSTACEALALLLQLKYMESERVGSNWSYESEKKSAHGSSVFATLDVKMAQIMKESSKAVGKKARRTQRATLKDVLHTIETGQGPHLEVQLDHELFSVSTWSRWFQVNVLRHALQSGFQVHLNDNAVLRDVFAIRTSAKTQVSMIPTARRRADRRTKTLHKREDRARKNASQDAFLYDG